jgi:hypothetical protein
MVRPKVIFTLPRLFPPQHSAVHPAYELSTADEGMHNLQTANAKRNSVAQNRKKRRDSLSADGGKAEDDFLFCNEGNSIGTSEVLAFNFMVENMKNPTMQDKIGANLVNRKSSFRSKLQSVQGRNPNPGSDEVTRNIPGQESVVLSYSNDSMKLSIRNDFGCGADNFVRKICTSISGSKWFERLVMLAAVAHSSLVIIEVRHNFPIYIDIAFAAFFTLEMLIQIIAWGFCVGPSSYLQSNIFNRISFGVTLWNWIEVGEFFYLTVLSIFEYLIAGGPPIRRFQLHDSFINVVSAIEGTKGILFVCQVDSLPPHVLDPDFELIFGFSCSPCTNTTFFRG